MTSFRKKF